MQGGRGKGKTNNSQQGPQEDDVSFRFFFLRYIQRCLCQFEGFSSPVTWALGPFTSPSGQPD
jgi:hypothetical protein